MYRTGISWYRSGNTKCWFGNVNTLPVSLLVGCRVGLLRSILPVLVYISTKYLEQILESRITPELRRKEKTSFWTGEVGIVMKIEI